MLSTSMAFSNKIRQKKRNLIHHRKLFHLKTRIKTCSESIAQKIYPVQLLRAIKALPLYDSEIALKRLTRRSFASFHKPPLARADCFNFNFH